MINFARYHGEDEDAGLFGRAKGTCDLIGNRLDAFK
jgi:hypothetical protein